LFKKYTRLPSQVTAGRYDGTIDCADQMIAMVKKHNNLYDLYFEDDTHLVLRGPDGTNDLLEGWWLVKGGHDFEVMTDEQFKDNYWPKE